MEDKKSKLLLQVRNIFEKLKTGDNSVLKCFKLVKLITNAENLAEINKTDKKIIPLQLDYVEKRDIDRMTLYSTDGPFQLVHADVGVQRLIQNTVW